MNYEHVFQSLIDPDVSIELPEPRSPVLIVRLPHTNVLDAEGKASAKRAYSQALVEQELSTALETASLADPRPRSSSAASASASTLGRSMSRNPAPPSRPVRKLAFWELLRAIEKKDLQTILEFELLCRKEGGNMPLLHCLRLGKSHADVAVVLTGAFSKWVNLLDESQPTTETRKLAIAVRANLRLAINASIQSNQTELIASYLSVIVASSGDKWLRDTTQTVAVALRAGPSGRPVHTASTAIRSFATFELRSLTLPGTVAISSVADYLANAAADLLLMAAWQLLPINDKSEIPLWYFARDDRLYKAFVERLHPVEPTPEYRKLPKVLRSQVEALRQTLEPRAIGFREKIESLESILDQGTI